jgi:hypothetical protein
MYGSKTQVRNVYKVADTTGDTPLPEYILYVIPRNRNGRDVIVDITAHVELEGPYITGKLSGVRWSKEVKKRLRTLHLGESDKLDFMDIPLALGIHAQFDARCNIRELKDAGFRNDSLTNPPPS